MNIMVWKWPVVYELAAYEVDRIRGRNGQETHSNDRRETSCQTRDELPAFMRAVGRV